MEFSQGPLWFTTPYDHQLLQSSKYLLPPSPLSLRQVSSQTHPQHCSCQSFTSLPLAPAILDNSVQAESHSRPGSEGTEKHLLSLASACRESLSTGKQHTWSRYQSTPLSQPVNQTLNPYVMKTVERNGFGTFSWPQFYLNPNNFAIVRYINGGMSQSIDDWLTKKKKELVVHFKNTPLYPQRLWICFRIYFDINLHNLTENIEINSSIKLNNYSLKNAHREIFEWWFKLTASCCT